MGIAQNTQVTFTSIVFPRNDDSRGQVSVAHGEDAGPRPLGDAVKPLTCVSNFVTGPAKPTIVRVVGHSPKCNWHSFVFVKRALRLAEYL